MPNLATNVLRMATLATLVIAGCSSTPTSSPPAASASPSVSASATASASPAASLLSIDCSEGARCTLDPGRWVTAVDGVPEGAFLPGLSFQVFTPSWSSREHWQSELELNPVDPDGVGEVRFWIDMAPAGADGKADPTRQFEAADFVNWVVTNPDLVAGTPRPATVAGLSATVVDFTVSPTAQSSDPQCPVGCADTVGRPHINCCIGYGQGEFIREYFLDVGFLAERHTLLIDLDSPSQAQLEMLNTLLQPILESLMLPAQGQWIVWCGRTGPPHHDCSG